MVSRCKIVFHEFVPNVACSSTCRLFQNTLFRSQMTTEADKLDEEICKEASSFTKIFYDAMDRKRDKINYLYCDSGATLVWNGNPVSGCDNIFKFISSLPETDHHLVSVDVQRVNAGLPGSPDLLTVTTAGNVTLGGTMHGFTHTFILMVEDGKYKVNFSRHIFAGIGIAFA
ncbi:nuclear transport factor 2 domain protein [Ancylostoma duodenale]|uniref:Nuclear transport factor 2 domain protein n=1 Tax=Ancylostoma duodenale TaxID=51022 RepID=A0A0C2G787_9BILA|nr:nuclear transport factor 2 domain protein [Ancylostoma duodenale]